MNRAEEFFATYFPAAVLPEDVVHPFAKALVALLRSGRYDCGKLVGCHGNESDDRGINLVVVDLEIDIGQKPPINDIRPVERIAVACFDRDTLPFACPMREDFPYDLAHIFLAPEDQPPALCLFAMPIEEAIRIATPFVFLERARVWLRDSAHDRLHGPDQPLDPRFDNSGKPVVVPPFEEMAKGGQAYRGYQLSGAPRAPIILKPEGSLPRHYGNATAVSIIMIITPPLAHTRLRALPQTMKQFLARFEEMGIDMLKLLKAELRKWRSSEQRLLQGRCMVIVCMPIERSPGVHGAVSTKAFDIECSAEDLAIDLGALVKAGGQLAPLLTHVEPDMVKLEQLPVHALDVYRSFDRAAARVSSGRAIPTGHPDAITLIGAGAIGSQIGLTAARMGWGLWTIVDPDHVMPHNLARHALLEGHQGCPKAEALAFEIRALLGEDAARSVVAPIGEAALEPSILSGAQLIVDASASVPVSRWLATEAVRECPCVSVFVNPAGSDLVILWESAERTPRLDYVEMSYYWMLACDAELADHLGASKEGIFPSGGCREPSMQISQADIGTLSSIAADRLSRMPVTADGAIEIWRRSDDGITVKRGVPAKFIEVEQDGWTIAISQEAVRGMKAARDAAGEFETGGILIGIWDKPRGRVYVVGFCPPPPDSVASRTGFVRGAEGVYRALDAMTTATAANLTYIGEWHSHPPGYASHPSSDDAILLEWIEEVLVFSGVPPIMAIAGSDGLRICLGRPSCSVLVDGPSTISGHPPATTT